MEKEYYRRYEPFFGEWRLGRFIGAGSYGKVFEIERRDALGTVSTSAMKALTIPSSQDELDAILASGMDEEGVSDYFQKYVDDIKKEIALMQRLKGHSTIVSYEDHRAYPHPDGRGWDILIRMELLRPINDDLRRQKIFTRAEVLRLGIDLCSALEVCQKNNIIHRDIKPGNIFLSREGSFKLGDFGVARIASASMAASTRAGTVNYMAPEVFQGRRYTSSVDIYSLGLVLYQLLNMNRMPFPRRRTSRRTSRSAPAPGGFPASPCRPRLRQTRPLRRWCSRPVPGTLRPAMRALPRCGRRWKR